jgi:hypothetical protein
MSTEAIAPENLDRQAEAVVREASKDADSTALVDPHEDRTRELKTPGFQRMRTDWHGADAAQISGLRRIVDGRILHLFPDAFMLMNDIYQVVRDPIWDPATGETVKDANGFDVWARSDSGAFIEDYTRLGIRDRENFLFRITTGIFEWKQTAADLWGDAMFAKAQWEEAMSRGFTEPEGRLTVDDRTNRARVNSVDERYFSIFQSLLSRRADAVVSGMELLGQRLKDVIS